LGIYTGKGLVQTSFEPNLHLYKYPSKLVPVNLFVHATYLDGRGCSETSAHKIQTLGITQKKEYNILFHVSCTECWTKSQSFETVPKFKYLETTPTHGWGIHVLRCIKLHIGLIVGNSEEKLTASIPWNRWENNI
jgi:hypothetical protein